MPNEAKLLNAGTRAAAPVVPGGGGACGRAPARSRPGAAAGFTLLEVMLASMILAFVIVTTMGVISHASTYLADLRLRARSSQVLQQRLEELRVMNWGQVTNCPSTFTSAADTNGTYAGSLTLSSYQAIGSTTVVVRATAMVTWTNRHSRVTSNQLTTLISNGGLNKTTL